MFSLLLPELTLEGKTPPCEQGPGDTCIYHYPTHGVAILTNLVCAFGPIFSSDHMSHTLVAVSTDLFLRFTLLVEDLLSHSSYSCSKQLWSFKTPTIWIGGCNDPNGWPAFGIDSFLSSVLYPSTFRANWQYHLRDDWLFKTHTGYGSFRDSRYVGTYVLCT